MGETTISRLVDKVNELSDSGRELSAQLAAKDREIAELRERVAIFQRGEALALGQMGTATIERDESRRHLGELLAVIHRDGGQYQAEHGAAKAVEDGMSMISELRDLYRDMCDQEDMWLKTARERDEARECVGRLCAALSEIDTESPRDEPAPAESDAGDHGIRVGMYSLAVIARAALAATPEHLRR